MPAPQVVEYIYIRYITSSPMGKVYNFFTDGEGNRKAYINAKAHRTGTNKIK